VAVTGVLAGPQGVADDGILIDPRQSGCLADAAAVLGVLADREGLRVGQPGAEQSGAFAFGETLLAGAAGEHAQLVLAVAKADAQVALAAQAVSGALGVLTAKQVKFIHESYRRETSEKQ
jgi:hypothetical protein